MAMRNVSGKANYEPNSIGGEEGGPRECHKDGFQSFAAEEDGRKTRARAGSFSDHYSQARQFYISQTELEQGHIADALIFELSKVERPAIRERVVSHLPHIDAGLAGRVKAGLGLRYEVKPAVPAVVPRTDLPASKALSIALNPPGTFRGRCVGALVSDGVDRALLEALRAALGKEGATLAVIAPTVGGVEASDGTVIAADQKVGGGPSILYDAVVVLTSAAGAAELAKSAAARAFVADAFVHLKFVGFVKAAMPLLDKAGIGADMDAGVIALSGAASATAFVATCRKLRHWERAEVAIP